MWRRRLAAGDRFEGIQRRDAAATCKQYSTGLICGRSEHLARGEFDALTRAPHTRLTFLPIFMALELRPNCECCDRDLPPVSIEAYICTFECTFCRDCAAARLHFVCPNCGGELVRRPVRPAVKLLKNPASTVRVRRSAPCVSAA